jgi:hypothetical protein
MPSNETKQKNLTVKPQSDSVRKAPGTRIGTLFDWRGGSNNSEKNRHGATIRDGR